MAQIELKYGSDPEMRKLAQDIIDAQGPEIKQMQDWLKTISQQRNKYLIITAYLFGYAVFIIAVNFIY